MSSPKRLHQPEIKRGLTWHIEWYTEVTGERKRIRKSKTEKGIELNAIADLAEREAEAEKMVKALRATLAPVVDDPTSMYFIDALKVAVELKRSTKRSTNKSYGEIVRWFIEFLEMKGHRYLRCNAVQFSHFQDYFDHNILKLKVRNTTYNYRKNNLRAVITELVKRGYLAENFVSKISNRPTEDPIRRPLSPSEFATYLNYVAANDRGLYLATLLLGYLAIRPGEMRDLKVGAFDFRRNMVVFPASKSKNNKNSAVTIPADLVEILKSFEVEKYPASYFLFGEAKGRHNAQLLPREKQIGEHSLSKKFRTTILKLKKTGALVGDIEGVQLYSLKDTLAIYLLDNGIGIEEAMRHFRQHSLAVFQKYVKRLGTVNEGIRALQLPALPKAKSDS